MAENIWNQANLKKLKAMTDKGISTSEIGKKLGITKNAVVGKLNRMGWNAKSKLELDKKPAPIAKTGAAAKKKPGMPPRKNVAKTPVKKAAPQKQAPTAKSGQPVIAPPKKNKGATKKSLAAHQRIVQHSLDLANLKPDQCRWPLGDPDSENFHFCGKTVFVGKPYCYDHCLAAYQMTPPKKK
jgi:GcrA cell cycle regulator